MPHGNAPPARPDLPRSDQSRPDLSRPDPFTEFAAHESLPIALVDELKRLSGASYRQLTTILHIPQGSFYALKNRNALLSPEISRRVRSVALILIRCRRLFPEKDRAARWLHNPQWALDDLSPWVLLATEQGLQDVESLLDELARGDRAE